VSVGDPTTLDVNVLSPRELSLVPKKIGTTNLVLWEAGGAPALVVDVNVGSNYSPIEHRIESALGTPGVKVESAGESVVLTGSVPSPVHADRAMAVAKAFFPKKPNEHVVNALTVGGNQQVMLEVVMAEMQRSLGRNMTFNFTTVIESGGKIYGIDSMLGSLMSIDERELALSPATLAKSFNFGDRIDLAGTFIKEATSRWTCSSKPRSSRAWPAYSRSRRCWRAAAGGQLPGRRRGADPDRPGRRLGSITIEFRSSAWASSSRRPCSARTASTSR
jgi:pilus assembly protein CpaC